MTREVNNNIHDCLRRRKITVVKTEVYTPPHEVDFDHHVLHYNDIAVVYHCHIVCDNKMCAAIVAETEGVFFIAFLAGVYKHPLYYSWFGCYSWLLFGWRVSFFPFFYKSWDAISVRK